MIHWISIFKFSRGSRNAFYFFDRISDANGAELTTFCLEFFPSHLVVAEFDPVCSSATSILSLSVYRSSPLDRIAHSSVSGLSLGPEYTCSIFAAGFQGPRCSVPCIHPRCLWNCVLSSDRNVQRLFTVAPFLTLENKSSELDKIRRIAVYAIRVVRLDNMIA